MTEGLALILIPCCQLKLVTSKPEAYSKPLMEIPSLRGILLDRLRQTPHLANRIENKRGILDANSTTTSALDMYIGPFYDITRQVLRDISEGNYPALDLLIVSALYGLLKPNEEVKEYNLTMGDITSDGTKVYRFWQANQLSRALHTYVLENGFTNIWSLLPDSLPDFAYHRVFNRLWNALRDARIRALHVQVPGAGSGTGRKRAAWLVEVTSENADYLLERPHPHIGFPAFPASHTNMRDARTRTILDRQSQDPSTSRRLS